MKLHVNQQEASSSSTTVPQFPGETLGVEGGLAGDEASTRENRLLAGLDSYLDHIF